MKTAADSAKAKFIGLFITSLVMCIVVMAAFWGPLPVMNGSSGTDDRMVRGSTESNPTFSGRVMPDDANDTAMMAGAERSLNASLDSLHGGKAVRPEQVAATLALFREAIKDPKSVSVIGDALHNKNKAGTEVTAETDKLKDSILVQEGQIVSLQNELKNMQSKSAGSQPEVAKMKKDLTDKEAVIAGLQNQLKAQPKESGVNAQAMAKMKEDLSSKDAQIVKLNNQLKARPGGGASSGLADDNKKLSDENNFLKWAVRSEVSSNHNLTNMNNSLKQANAVLQNQVNELKKK